MQPQAKPGIGDGATACWAHGCLGNGGTAYWVKGLTSCYSSKKGYTGNVRFWGIAPICFATVPGSKVNRLLPHITPDLPFSWLPDFASSVNIEIAEIVKKSRMSRQQWQIHTMTRTTRDVALMHDPPFAPPLGFYRLRNCID